MDYINFLEYNRLQIDKARLEELKKHFKTNRNELSLAFQECDVDNSENILFLGDATRLDIENLNITVNLKINTVS